MRLFMRDFRSAMNSIVFGVLRLLATLYDGTSLVSASIAQYSKRRQRLDRHLLEGAGLSCR